MERGDGRQRIAPKIARRVARARRTVARRRGYDAVDDVEVAEQLAALVQPVGAAEDLHQHGGGHRRRRDADLLHLVEELERARRVGQDRLGAHGEHRVEGDLVGLDAEVAHLLPRRPRRRRLGRREVEPERLLVRVHVDQRRVDRRVADLRHLALLQQPEEGLAAPQLPRAAAALDQVRVRARVGRVAAVEHLLEVAERRVEVAQLDARVDQRRVRLVVRLALHLRAEVLDDGRLQRRLLHHLREEEVLRRVRRDALVLLLEQQRHRLADRRGARRRRRRRAGAAERARRERPQTGGCGVAEGVAQHCGRRGRRRRAASARRALGRGTPAG